MEKKEKNVEQKNNEVNEPQMTTEQMEQFVKDNIAIVPKNQRKRFDSMMLELKVRKIGFYLDCQRLREEAIERNKLENKVGELLIRRKATTEDVLKVIEYCKKFIEATREAEINKLQMEIDRLSSLKRTLESN